LGGGLVEPNDPVTRRQLLLVRHHREAVDHQNDPQAFLFIPGVDDAARDLDGGLGRGDGFGGVGRVGRRGDPGDGSGEAEVEDLHVAPRRGPAGRGVRMPGAGSLPRRPTHRALARRTPTASIAPPEKACQQKCPMGGKATRNSELGKKANGKRQ